MPVANDKWSNNTRKFGLDFLVKRILTCRNFKFTLRFLGIRYNKSKNSFGKLRWRSIIINKSLIFFFKRGVSGADGQIGAHPFITPTGRGRGSGSGGRMWTGEGGPAPCGRPHRKLKLESTDVILSSSHAKKLAFFLPEFRLWTEKKLKFVCDIN